MERSVRDILLLREQNKTLAAKTLRMYCDSFTPAVNLLSLPQNSVLPNRSDGK